MRNKKFYDLEQAERYLNGSVIRLNKTPIFIDRITPRADDFRIRYTEVGDPEPHQIYLSDKKINMNPIPLGLVNIGRDCIFAQRMAMRAWKVGLSGGNLYISELASDEFIDRDFRQKLLTSKKLKDTVLNKYPRPQKIVEAIDKKKVLSRAFSRRFWIDHRGQVKYKTVRDPVGYFSRDRGEALLNPPYEYLSEALKEDLAR